MENKFTELCQVSVIVRDREKIMQNMKEVFGVEPDLVAKTVLDENSMYYGKKGNYSAELIFYRFAGVEIEFVVPLGGESIWQDFLDEHGEGLHHVLFNVDSYDEAVAQMESHGMPLVQSGSSIMGTPGAKWGYFDTKDKLPFIVEIKNTAECNKKAAMEKAAQEAEK